jgi:hypothetical protein
MIIFGKLGAPKGLGFEGKKGRLIYQLALERSLTSANCYSVNAGLAPTEHGCYNRDHE